MGHIVKTTLIHTIDVQNILGEGIQWHAERNEIWWTDIAKNQLFCMHWPSKELTIFDTPEPVCSFAFVKYDTQTPLRLLIAFASGIAYYIPSRNQVDWIHPNVTDTNTARLNDGRVDRQGRFWVGSMSVVDSDYAQDQGRGKLYCLDHNENLSIHADNIHIANGTCWSPNSKFMYFADSARHAIYRYSFNKDTGAISQRETIKYTGENTFPDGACIDSKAYLWSAHWGANKVVRYTSDGEIDTEVHIPVSHPSCVAFGGENLNLLFVTSAKQGLSPAQLTSEPKAGNVFIFETNVSGLNESQYFSNIL